MLSQSKKEVLAKQLNLLKILNESQYGRRSGNSMWAAMYLHGKQLDTYQVSYDQLATQISSNSSNFLIFYKRSCLIFKANLRRGQDNAHVFFATQFKKMLLWPGNRYLQSRLNSLMGVSKAGAGATIFYSGMYFT